MLTTPARRTAGTHDDDPNPGPAQDADTRRGSGPAGTIARILTGRRSAWVSLLAGLAVMAALFGVFASASAPALNDQAPADSESARAAALLDTFPDADRQSVLLVATRSDGQTLTETDTAALADLRDRLTAAAGTDGTDASGTDGTDASGTDGTDASGTEDAEASGAGRSAAPPQLSADTEAAVATLPITVGASNTQTAETIGQLRTQIAAERPAGLDVLVTGGPAFGADIAAAFDGADVTLLTVTIGIVAVLLILTYRSPVLWLLPLGVVALADGLAGRLTAAAGEALSLQFDAGIISVLVFGAGTNYALLLISRYREELGAQPDHRTALARAWQASLPAILASNLTVVLALATLGLAVIPGTRGLGASAAIGLLIALAAVLLVLPPLLAVCGRRAFWPVIPRPSDAPRAGGLWRAAAGRVVRRPLAHLAAGAALLGLMATGLIGTSVGLDQLDRFRVPSESAAGLEVVSEHFDPGDAQPILVVARSGQAEAVTEAAAGVTGVVRAHPLERTADGALTSIMVTSAYAPSSQASLEQIAQLRTAVHAVPGAEAVVGGAVAADVDARAGGLEDLVLIVPLILLISAVVLAVLLRSLIAPAVLLVLNVASALAAIGAGAWLSGIVFGTPGLDLQVPLLSFLFLVALGIDYSIFLVHRARSESRVRGTRAGIVEAVAHTGAVITSAGVVLAAVFAALGVLPLVTLGQLGLIVGLGVLVDTLVVRTVLVPAVFALLADRVWWPGRAARQQAAGHPRAD